MLSGEAEAVLILKAHSARARKSRSAALARRGYLGFYAFAEWLGDEFAIRLRPGAPAEAGAAVEAPKSVAEAMTFAPDLRLLVAGRLISLHASRPLGKLTATQRKAVEKAARDLGDEVAAPAVLDCLRKLGNEADPDKRIAALCEAAGADVPLFRALPFVWTSNAHRTHLALDQLSTRLLDVPFLPGLWLSLCALYKTSRDLEEAAWRVICGDAVADFTYDGFHSRPGHGDWSATPWIHAVAALKAVRLAGLDPRRAAALKAARAFAAARDRYDGAAHLEGARKLAAKDPGFAWTLTCNAAAFHCRSQKSPPMAAVRFAHDLAAANEWADLTELLSWAITGA